MKHYTTKDPNFAYTPSELWEGVLTDFQPGNGSRYEIFMIQDGHRLLVAMGNGAVGKGMYHFGNTGDNVHPVYVGEKLGLRPGDQVEVTTFINTQIAVIQSTPYALAVKTLL